MEQLDYLKINTHSSPDKAIVFIHGWKGNKDSFKTLPRILNIKKASWFFPQAPYELENNGSYSWSYQNKQGEWEENETKFLLKKFIKEKVLSLFNEKKIFFIGFSQGATVCYEFILSLNYTWGGVFPVAGFFRDFKEGIRLSSMQTSTPILIGHGMTDDIVPIEASENSYKFLKDNNCNVSFMKYKGGHKISLDYLKRVNGIIDGSIR